MMGKNKKMLVSLLALTFAVSLSGGLFANVKAYADAPATVTDNADQVGGEGAATADVYGLTLQSGDVGFGADGRYVTNKAPTAAPTATTWWEENYGYAHYTLAGQNLVKVTVDIDPSAKEKLSPAFCYVQGVGALEVSNTVVQTSENWTRITYTYEISDPAKAEWLRVIPSAYNDTASGLETWMQQITKVEISYVEEETPVVPATVTDNADQVGGEGAVTADIYGLTLQSGDVGFGADGRYVTNKAPTAAPTATTWWEENYGYAHYTLAGQNLVKVTVDIEPGAKEKLSPAFCYVQGVGALEVNNTVVETSGNWTRITYTYIITDPAKAEWLRVIPSVYNDKASGLETWMQQITKVEISYAETLPEKDPVVTPDPETPVEVAKIEDTCGALDNSVSADIYGMTLQNGDVGFGEDSRYTTSKEPETAPATDTMWNAEYAYVQYNVAGQNLLTVVADIPAEVLTKIPHPVVYERYSDVNDGKVLELNNYSVETSSNWSRVTYKYILDANVSWVRILIGAYNAWDGSVFTWQQQITNVTVEKVDILPEKDENIPTIELAPEKSETPDVPVDEAALATVHTDICNGNLIEGLRADVYNVDVKGDKSALIGDGDRIVFGGNPGASESYIDYKMPYMDTIAVTTYEEISENNTRPEGATQIKFAVWLDGKCVAWEVDAKRTEVELGDSASGRWSKIVWYYQLEEAIENAKIRIMIAKPTEGQVENQLGRVDIYNSEYADLTKLAAKQDVERYSFLKGQTNYETESWNALQEIMVVALTDLDNAESAEQIEQILTKAKADMDAIKTSAQEFEEAKTLKKQEIADYATEKGQDNYTEEAWAEIMGYVTEAQGKIDAASGMSQINVAILDAKDAIDQVETKPVESQPGESGSEQSGLTSVEDGNGDDGSTVSGCFGSVFSLVMMAPVALGAAAIILKKKED